MWGEPDMDQHSGNRNRKGPPRTDFQRPVHCLLGLPFDAVNIREAVDRIGTAAELHSPCFLSTPNLNFVVASQHDPAFRDSVIRSDLSVADGMPLVWLARLVGVPIPERVAGSDIFEAFMRGEGRPLKVFFFGGPDGVAEAACARLNAIPGPVRCVGYISPGMGPVEQMSRPEYIERINRSGADFVAVALGARKGQAWIERNRRALNAPVVSHLGAVVNFIAGTVSRAPVVVRRLGLEWLWRIKEEPALWRRYAADALALAQLLILRILPSMVRRAPPAGRVPADASLKLGGRSTRLTLAGSWSDADLPNLRRMLETATRVPADIDLDILGLVEFDEAFIGTLMLLYGHQSKIARRLRVLAVTPGTRRNFRVHCAEFLLEGLEDARAAARSGESTSGGTGGLVPQV